MTAVKVALADGRVIGVLDRSVDDLLWLQQEGLRLMSDVEREPRHLGVLVQHVDGGAVHKIEILTMDVEVARVMQSYGKWERLV